MQGFLVHLKNLSVITMIAGLITGVILIARPDQAVQLVCILFGATLILLGIGALISYFTRLKFTLLAIVGVLCIIAGVIVCIKYESIVSAVIFIFGLFITISGIVDFISSLDARKNNLKSWVFSLVMSIGVTVLGVIVLVNPFDSAILLTRLLGLSLIIYAMLDLITFIQVRKMFKLKTVNLKGVDHIDIDGEDIE